MDGNWRDWWAGFFEMVGLGSACYLVIAWAPELVPVIILAGPVAWALYHQTGPARPNDYR